MKVFLCTEIGFVLEIGASEKLSGVSDGKAEQISKTRSAKAATTPTAGLIPHFFAKISFLS